MSLLFEDKLSEAIKSLLMNETHLRIAVAFIGDGASEKWINPNATDVKIICNLTMNGTNPAEVQKLIQRFGAKNVKQIDNLHAKLYIGSEYAIAGSANLSANGLGTQPTALREAGYKFKLDKLSGERGLDWFDDLWEKASEITDQDLKDAAESWEHRDLARNGEGEETLKIKRYPDKRHPNISSTMTFDDYYGLCKQEKVPGYSNPFDERMRLLETIRFAKLSQAQSQADIILAAGLKSVNQSTGQPGSGWFGGMNGDAAFRDLIKNPRCNNDCPLHWNQMRNLINGLPPKLNRGDYDDFLDNFYEIINDFIGHSNNYHGTIYRKISHFSAATRILAMSRPDQFFCLNGANAADLAYDFGISVNGVNGIRSAGGYWNVCQDLQNSLWGRSTPQANWPSDKQACWDNRVAMIDALYYS